MEIISDLKAWRSLRKTFQPDLSIGFVPTMGNLHQGHFSLYQRSLSENDLSIASIFVNRAQFNNPSDYTHYPRTLEADLEALEALGVDYCLTPSEDMLYPDQYRYRIDETEQTLRGEGQHRPGHFAGVLTVVMKLFQLVQPNKAYFGEKDYQQYQLIHDMAEAFFLDVSVVLCPTIRESSGLAYSSRNNRLTPAEKKQAETFAQLFRQSKLLGDIERDLIQAGIHIDYLEEIQGRRYAAVKIGAVRLIDNYGGF